MLFVLRHLPPHLILNPKIVMTFFVSFALTKNDIVSSNHDLQITAWGFKHRCVAVFRSVSPRFPMTAHKLSSAWLVYSVREHEYSDFPAFGTLQTFPS